MYVITLDNHKLQWRPKGHKQAGCSSYHLRARNLLTKLFPSSQILEEVSFNPTKQQTLFFDFYIPIFCIAIEVHGEQHYSFSSHFHKDKLQFLDSQKRDRQKAEWCQLNDITLVTLPYNEKEDDWEIRIYKRTDKTI